MNGGNKNRKGGGDKQKVGQGGRKGWSIMNGKIVLMHYLILYAPCIEVTCIPKRIDTD
jgi:hypothetical protein